MTPVTGFPAVATLPAVSTRKTLCCLALGALLGVSGCGGGTSEEDFAERANAVCASAEKASPALDGSSPQELMRTINRLAGASRRQAEEMMRLEAPDGREDDVKALVAQLEQRTRLLDRVRAATRERGADGFNTALRENAGEGRSTNEEADRIARELGLDKCLNNSRGD